MPDEAKQKMLAERARAVEQTYRQLVRSRLEDLLRVLSPHDEEDWGLRNYPSLLTYGIAALRDEVDAFGVKPE